MWNVSGLEDINNSARNGGDGPQTESERRRVSLPRQLCLLATIQ
jgi:hypothetical protein